MDREARVGDRRIRKGLSAAFDALGYQVRRKQPPKWGADAYVDQERLLKGSPVGVVMDVGANVGDTVQHYRTLFPDATIYAFEPFPGVHRQLVERFASDPRVRPHQAAVTAPEKDTRWNDKTIDRDRDVSEVSA